MKSKKTGKINKINKKTKTVKKGGAGKESDFKRYVKGRYGANNVNPAYYNNPRRILSNALEAYKHTNNSGNRKSTLRRKPGMKKTKPRAAASGVNSTVSNSQAAASGVNLNVSNRQGSTNSQPFMLRVVGSTHKRTMYPNSKQEKDSLQQYLVNQQRVNNQNNLSSSTNQEPIYGNLAPPGRLFSKLTIQGNSLNVSTEATGFTEPRELSRKFSYLRNLVDKFKVFVWDFDDTIANKEKARLYSESHNDILEFTPSTHLSMDPLLLQKLRDNAETSPGLVQNLFFNPEEFVQLTSYLVSNGCSVYIASFGFINNIIEILNMLYSSYGQPSPFSRRYGNVYGLEDDSPAEKSKWRTKKIGFLNDIKEKHHGQNILFFDDDQANVIAQFDKSNIYGIKLGGYKSKQPENSEGERGFHIGVLGKILMYLNTLSKSDTLDKRILMDIVFS